MFNILSTIPDLFLLTLFSFLTLFTVRQLLIKRKIFIFFYHICLFCILFIASIGGGGVQNDGYMRLEQFILLEKNNQLEEAKKNPQNYDSMLQIDLHQFRNSDEFRDYLKIHDARVDKAEAVFIGWLFVLLAEIAMWLRGLACCIRSKIKKS